MAGFEWLHQIGILRLNDGDGFSFKVTVAKYLIDQLMRHI